MQYLQRLYINIRHSKKRIKEKVIYFDFTRIFKYRNEATFDESKSAPSRD